MKSTRIVTSGPSNIFLPLLTVLFIGLKLTGHIEWSWWWVLSPLWAPFGIVFGIWGVLILGALLYAAFSRS